MALRFLYLGTFLSFLLSFFLSWKRSKDRSYRKNTQMLLSSRPIAIVSLVSLLCLSLFLLRLRSQYTPSPSLTQKQTPSQSSQSNQAGCSGNLTRLKDLENVKFPIKYARRDIIVKSNSDLHRTALTQIDAPLLPDLQLVDLVNSPDQGLQQCSPPLILEVPRFPTQHANASHIIFGISTYMERMQDSLPHLQRSLANTSVQLIILAIKHGEATPRKNEMAALESRMRSLGIEATVVGAPKNSLMQARYFSLVRLLYERRDSATQWIALLDDDTFLPSMHSLVNTLDSYDPSKEWYLGAMSEDWWSVMVYGMMSFGGGGTFLSLPLAAQIDAYHNTCVKETYANQGDIRLFECITSHTTTKLQPVPGLHQMDLGGDLSGFYESGRLPLSLHHWKTGRHFARPDVAEYVPDREDASRIRHLRRLFPATVAVWSGHDPEQWILDLDVRG